MLPTSKNTRTKRSILFPILYLPLPNKYDKTWHWQQRIKIQNSLSSSSEIQHPRTRDVVGQVLILSISQNKPVDQNFPDRNPSWTRTDWISENPLDSQVTLGIQISEP